MTQNSCASFIFINFTASAGTDLTAIISRVHLDCLVSQENKEHKVLKEFLEIRETRVRREVTEGLDSQVRREFPVMRAKKGKKVNKDPRETEVHLGKMEKKGRKESQTSVNQVRQLDLKIALFIVYFIFY